MKNSILVIFFLIFLSSICCGQVTIKGTTVGTRTPEIEEIVQIDGFDYLMKSLNNKSGICSFLSLVPVDSEKEILDKWVTLNEFSSILKTFQNNYGEKFKKRKENDMLSYVHKTNGCEIQIILLNSKQVYDGYLYKMIIEIWHLKELEKHLKELSLSWEDWNNRNINK